jgi:hypothetical protein
LIFASLGRISLNRSCKVDLTLTQPECRQVLQPQQVFSRFLPWLPDEPPHWEVLAAADFFIVEIWNAAGLFRYHVFFVIRLASRAVKIAGIIPEPTGPWM